MLVLGQSFSCYNAEAISILYEFKSNQYMPLSLYQFPFQAMGSTCNIQLYANNKLNAQNIADLVVSDVRRIEQKYSRYRNDSVLTAINNIAESAGSIQIDEETLALLKYADTCYQQSGGLFDITSGVLREVWDFKTGEIPKNKEIKKILPKIGWNKLSIRDTSLSFSVKGMQLDFGGIGKEYAVDRAATICKQHGFQHGLIDLGGDIKVIGPHADGRPWSVGIRHPRKPGELMSSINVSRGAVASSGDYEKCIILNGKRYSHVLNPKTGWPVRGLSSITVIAEQCVIAGSITTISMLKETKGKRWLKGLGLSYLWMDQQGKVGSSLNKHGYIQTTA
ncbi:MAG: FAD:protein FMN transferase [Methylococcales bacterium]